MATQIPTPGASFNIGGAMIADSLYPNNEDGLLIIAANSNNPPTVKLGTRFHVYSTGTFLIPATTATGNSVYPAGVTTTFLKNYVIFELADQTLAWGTAAGPTSAGTPAKVNSTTYYLFCSATQDVDNTSRGKGLYGVSTNAPTYDPLKGGFYSSDGRVLCQFKTDGSGNVGNILVYKYDSWHLVGGTGEPAFQNSWVNIAAGGVGVAGFWKDPMGIVHLKGGVKSGTVGNAIFTLPAGWAPVELCQFAINSNSVFGLCTINTSGTVVATSGSNVGFFLDNITFYVGW